MAEEDRVLTESGLRTLLSLIKNKIPEGGAADIPIFSYDNDGLVPKIDDVWFKTYDESPAFLSGKGWTSIVGTLVADRNKCNFDKLDDGIYIVASSHDEFIDQAFHFVTTKDQDYDGIYPIDVGNILLVGTENGSSDSYTKWFVSFSNGMNDEAIIWTGYSSASMTNKYQTGIIHWSSPIVSGASSISQYEYSNEKYDIDKATGSITFKDIDCLEKKFILEITAENEVNGMTYICNFEYDPVKWDGSIVLVNYSYYFVAYGEPQVEYPPILATIYYDYDRTFTVESTVPDHPLTIQDVALYERTS